jgi:hypothetical protein
MNQKPIIQDVLKLPLYKTDERFVGSVQPPRRDGPMSWVEGQCSCCYKADLRNRPGDGEGREFVYSEVLFRRRSSVTSNDVS